jgi:hypothetical protein
MGPLTVSESELVPSELPIPFHHSVKTNCWNPGAAKLRSAGSHTVFALRDQASGHDGLSNVVYAPRIRNLGITWSASRSTRGKSPIPSLNWLGNRLHSMTGPDSMEKLFSLHEIKPRFIYRPSPP